MWFFKSKDLSEYSCDFKNSKRFWKFSEDPRDVFLFFDFGLRTCMNQLVENFVFLWKLSKFSNFQIQRSQEIFMRFQKFLKILKLQRKCWIRFFVFRFWPTEPHKRAPWSFCLSGSCTWTSQLNWLLPLISLGLTAWMGLFWRSHTKSNRLAQVNGNQWTDRVGYRLSENSQCLELPEPL